MAIFAFLNKYLKILLPECHQCPNGQTGLAKAYFNPTFMFVIYPMGGDHDFIYT